MRSCQKINATMRILPLLHIMSNNMNNYAQEDHKIQHYKIEGLI